MSKEHLHSLISDFDPIGLDEMDNVKLMNRVDTKFVLNSAQLLDTLPHLVEHYRILEIQGIRIPLYSSDYYDDQDFSFYTDHHRKRQDRFKVRYRKYVESNLSFLEVKHKNKGRTDKQRIVVPDLPNSMSENDKNFVETTGVRNEKLHKVLTNEFNRITLVGKERNERLTLDFNLCFIKDEKRVEMTDLIIAELKQERLIRTSPFYSLMKTMLIRPYRISKYCIGVIELYGKENIKYNRFKKKLLRIKKLTKNAA